MDRYSCLCSPRTAPRGRSGPPAAARSVCGSTALSWEQASRSSRGLGLRSRKLRLRSMLMVFRRERPLQSFAPRMCYLWRHKTQPGWVTDPTVRAAGLPDSCSPTGYNLSLPIELSQMPSAPERQWEHTTEGASQPSGPPQPVPWGWEHRAAARRALCSLPPAGFLTAQEPGTNHVTRPRSFPGCLQTAHCSGSEDGCSCTCV